MQRRSFLLTVNHTAITEFGGHTVQHHTVQPCSRRLCVTILCRVNGGLFFLPVNYIYIDVDMDRYRFVPQRLEDPYHTVRPWGLRPGQPMQLVEGLHESMHPR